MNFKFSSQTTLWLILISIMLVRLLFLGAYPLADTTEARYGEMGRLMLETGDWITPQFEKGVPFWGKPPLSFWLTAASFKIFGIHEFSARLPSFLLGVIIIAMVFSLGQDQAEKNTALVACVILASTVIFWISSGAVMTDHCLLAGTTLSMVAFWRNMTSDKKAAWIWGHLFFIGLSIGLMAKGPVAAVLVFFPVLSWAIIQKKWRLLVTLPWTTGIVLTAILTLPWYIAAEIKTPGFLEYFIIGEHWNRFLVPGWEGDLYGSAHSQPKGMIWGFWLVCALPWSAFLPYMLIKKKIRQSLSAKVGRSKEWYAYLAVWTVSPMIFFTLAGNILWAYVLPGIPAFALLAAEVIQGHPLADKGLLKTSGVILTLFLLVSHIVAFGVGPDKKSQKKMLKYFNRISHGETLHYLNRRPFSAEFYSGATAEEIPLVSGIENLFNDGQKDYLAVKASRINNIPEYIKSRFYTKKEINGYVLLQEK
ncbi:MAG TPA: glycosyltransferase family 39 protein [Desulfobacter sp.]|nr:glycosyltransferase family 39 protein [Desulfobacter sp.]